MKNRSFFTVLLVFILFYIPTYGQVGIGTTDPDASSILEMESTTQGVLTPRMTTVQRNAIGSPAKGLLVFDTDESVFQFYDGTVWLPLEGAEKRDNYKLIKSEADLADELTAGGGAEFKLTTNFLYEINGTITLTKPIDLNNAYLVGLDTNEDKLVNGTGDIFSGSKGGSIRNLTLVATVGNVFNLTGSATERLIFRDCVVASSNSVGNISGFGLFFSSIVQYVNNDSGVTYSNIHELLLHTQGWGGDNKGIYETYVGDFDMITKQGGFSEVVSATAGMKISQITSITGGASLRNVSFYGGGNYIIGTSPAPYTGYHFSNKWDVDCPGISVETDGVASGNFYYNGSLASYFSQSIPNSTTAIKIQGNGTFIANNLFRFSSSGGNRLIYDGERPRQFQVNASLSVRLSFSLSILGYRYYAFMIAKNGSVLTESSTIIYITDSNDIQNVALNTNVSLSPNDYVEIYVKRFTTGTLMGDDTLRVYSENLSIR